MRFCGAGAGAVGNQDRAAGYGAVPMCNFYRKLLSFTLKSLFLLKTILKHYVALGEKQNRLSKGKQMKILHCGNFSQAQEM